MSADSGTRLILSALMRAYPVHLASAASILIAVNGNHATGVSDFPSNGVTERRWRGTVGLLVFGGPVDLNITADRRAELH